MLAGRQTRPHRDLDLAVDAQGWVDLYPVRFDASGHGRQADLDGGHSAYPPDCFSQGALDGVFVPCLSREQQLRFREGYEPRDVDRHDVTLLMQLEPQ